MISKMKEKYFLFKAVNQTGANKAVVPYILSSRSLWEEAIKEIFSQRLLNLSKKSLQINIL